MTKLNDIANIRREYGTLILDEKMLPSSPFLLFEHWFLEAINTEQFDPNAMVLSTVNDKGEPDSRIVLLKGLIQEQFVFYTNYLSTKAIQIEKKPVVALNFYWPSLTRQVRIRGSVARTSVEQSKQYFLSRPYESQLSAIISPQSQEIKNREVLEEQLKQVATQEIKYPEYWGGYAVLPNEIEFFQGRDNRLHDRIHYFLKANKWHYRRLAP